MLVTRSNTAAYAAVCLVENPAVVLEEVLRELGGGHAADYMPNPGWDGSATGICAGRVLMTHSAMVPKQRRGPLRVITSMEGARLPPTEEDAHEYVHKQIPACLSFAGLAGDGIPEGGTGEFTAMVRGTATIVHTGRNKIGFGDPLVVDVDELTGGFVLRGLDEAGIGSEDELRNIRRCVVARAKSPALPGHALLVELL